MDFFKSDCYLFLLSLFSLTFIKAQQPKLILPIGHTAPIRSAQFSPNTKYVVTCSDDKTAIIWEAYTGKLLHKLEGHSGIINTAIFSSNGKHILTASEGFASVWDAMDGSLLYTLEGNSTDIKRWF